MPASGPPKRRRMTKKMPEKLIRKSIGDKAEGRLLRRITSSDDTRANAPIRIGKGSIAPMPEGSRPILTRKGEPARE